MHSDSHGRLWIDLPRSNAVARETRTFAYAYVPLLALPDIRAETVAERLVEDVFWRFGMPEFLHSDQGKQFESTLFHEMCKMLGIQKTRTTPYRRVSHDLVPVAVGNGKKMALTLAGHPI